VRTFRNRLSIVVALALGWIIGGFSASSPTAVAQVARVTLDSLQRQITQIIDGTTAVGNADEAAHAATADIATNAERLNGKPAADYVTADVLDDVLGTVLTTAGAGLTANAEVVGVDFDALDAEYLPRTGGTITGDLSVAGGVRVGQTTQAANSGNAGMLRFVGGKLQVSDGSSWIPLH
jgi:hypothetical protein